MASNVLNVCKNAKNAKIQAAKLSTQTKDEVLLACADALIVHTPKILEANAKDYDRAKANGMSPALLDRLLLDEKRVEGMADGLRQLATLHDPIGEVLSMTKRPNGLMIGQRRVPMGVVGIIYEARPNVTADAFGLCFKTGNVSILRSGSDAASSASAIVSVFKEVLSKNGLSEDLVSLLEDVDHEEMAAFMKMNAYVDLLIPRGGAGLIRSVVENATIPVIETGTGNCHIYIDESADLAMAVDIVENAKTQRIGVCNACESLVIHRKVYEQFLPMLKNRLDANNVEIRGDEDVVACYAKNGMTEGVVAASAQDWGKEYLDYILSAKVVDSLEEAITHINTYNTGHSEAIITQDYAHAMQFLDEIDAACVYVNASTRFTDGGEFGFGAEIGISTQKLHARGPMGLEALTTTKYIILGNGQVRP